MLTVIRSAACSAFGRRTSLRLEILSRDRYLAKARSASGAALNRSADTDDMSTYLAAPAAPSGGALH